MDWNQAEKMFRCKHNFLTKKKKKKKEANSETKIRTQKANPIIVEKHL